MSYKYRGNHQGPDLFDAPLTRGAHPSPFEEVIRQEREAMCRYWYARGYVDQEVAAMVGAGQSWVRDWRHRNGLVSNYDLIMAS